MTKILVKQFINFIWILVFAFLLTSCCGDDNYYDLSNEELSLLPYKINDTIILKNQQNDTLIFVCETRTTDYWCFSSNKYSFYCTRKEECFQSLSVNFISDSAIISIKLALEYYDQSFAYLSFKFENSDKRSIFSIEHKILDTLLVNGTIFTNVYEFCDNSGCDEICYLQPGKGLIKLIQKNNTYELIE